VTSEPSLLSKADGRHWSGSPTAYLIFILSNCDCFTGQNDTVDSLTMQNLLPSNVKDFFHYEGSYTTPNCKEAVVWTVFKEPITITSQQVDHRPISGCATLATVALFSHSCTYLTSIRNELTAMTDGRPLSTFNTTHKLQYSKMIMFLSIN